MLYLFDIDGTLIKTGGAGLLAFERAAVELLGAKDVLGGISFAGQTDPRLVEHVFLAKLGRAPSTSEIEEFLERYLTYLPAHILDTAYQVLPGVHAALDRLDERGAVLGLATGNVERGAQIKLAHGDLWRRFRLGGFGSDSADRACSSPAPSSAASATPAARSTGAARSSSSATRPRTSPPRMPAACPRSASPPGRRATRPRRSPPPAPTG